MPGSDPPWLTRVKPKHGAFFLCDELLCGLFQATVFQSFTATDGGGTGVSSTLRSWSLLEDRRVISMVGAVLIRIEATICWEPSCSYSHFISQQSCALMDDVD